jgi:hypothetical protein
VVKASKKITPAKGRKPAAIAAKLNPAAKKAATPRLHSLWFEKNVSIPMNDGVVLKANLVRPDAALKDALKETRDNGCSRQAWRLISAIPI